MTHYKNKLTHLPEQYKNNTTADGKHIGRWQSTKFLTEGESVFSFYLPTYAGVDKETGKSLWYTYQEDEKTGEKKRVTTDQYSVASADGREMQGDALPDLYGGFNTSLRCYGIDCSKRGLPRTPVRTSRVSSTATSIWPAHQAASSLTRHT